MKKRKVAAVLAIILGFLGVHRLYLGKFWQGMAYLFFSMLGQMIYVTIIISIFEGLVFLAMKDEEFDKLYNSKFLGK